jgi:aerobic carbon-monoxide dehydrogenase large subunit
MFTDDGRIVALRDHYVKDTGAYTPVGLGVPASTASHMMGQYQVPNFEARCTLIVTNKTANAPYRGAGKPEAAFVMERLIDLIAGELGLDPVEVRRRNMIKREQMPYNVGIPHRDGITVVYDSGDFPGALSGALEAIGGLDAFRAKQREAREAGCYLGLGFCCYVEETGSGPHEGATVRIDPSGGIIAITGACSAGHGHETVFSQVVADQWGVRPEDVTVVIGDSGSIPYGFGTFGSRSAVTSSAAIEMASRVLRKKVFAIAGNILECAVEDLELRDGNVAVKGSDLKVSFKDLARAGQPGWDHRRPPGMSGGLEVTEYFEPPSVTWAYATHAVIVEVDHKTGKVLIRKYVVSHDAGVLINPQLAEGQILGGVCQGIGGVLLERIVYSDGQLLTGSLVDYVVPTASDMPPIEIVHTEIPSPLNVLGIKGLGEGGIIGPPAAIANAVCDALQPLGFEVNSSFIDQGEIVAALNVSRTH